MNPETVLIERLRDLKVEAVGYEKEAADLRKKAKGLDKMGKAKRDQMDALLGKPGDPNQARLFEVAAPRWKCERCGMEFESNPGETHDVEIASTAVVDQPKEGEEPAPRTYGCGPVVQVAPAAPEPVDEDEEDGDEEEDEDEPDTAAAES